MREIFLIAILAVVGQVLVDCSNCPAPPHPNPPLPTPTHPSPPHPAPLPLSPPSVQRACIDMHMDLVQQGRVHTSNLWMQNGFIFPAL